MEVATSDGEEDDGEGAQRQVGGAGAAGGVYNIQYTI